VIGIGIIHFRDDVMAAISLAAEEENSADFLAMLAAVKSATLSPARAAP
jgi:hypothetical protein